MKIAITTDSNSGILPNEVEGQNIFVLPMSFIIDGKEYFENVDLTQDDFFARQSTCSEILTSQPSIFAVTEFWKNILKDYDYIVHIPMSSSLSSSTETAIHIAKDEFDGKVFVVDNQRISLSQKQSVYDAQSLAASGKTPQEIVDYLVDTKTENSIYIMVPDLKYLKKGGRITKTAAMIGTLLKIKPVLQIQGGKLDSYQKAMTVKKAREIMISAVKKDIATRFEKQFSEGKLNISIAYTLDKNVAEEFKNELENEIPNCKVIWINPLALSVSCHIGPGAIAVALSSVA
ncbi:MAG TPA: DegV family protein [Clostridiales bacterium]|nr:DegV family protein [Clostridiales bacterium]